MKKCYKCGETKDYTEFGKNRTKCDGYRDECKECCRVEKRKRKAKKLVENKLGKIGYLYENLEDILMGRHNVPRGLSSNVGAHDLDGCIPEGYFYCYDCKSLLTTEHQHHRRTYLCKPCWSLRLKARSPEERKKDNDSYRARNRERLVLMSRTYMKSDRAKKYRKEMRKKNRIELSIKRNIQDKLRRQFASKSSRTTELLGCSISEFKDYVASLFKPGMSWDNYGKYTWHLDHIRPCASFDLTDPEQQKICFHYTNYQPLWAEDNIKKGSWYEGTYYERGNAI